MKLNKCEICGANLVKNGKTSSGKQRGYCKKCKHSSIVKYDNSTYEFRQFIDGLLNNKRLKNMPGHGRSFQRGVDKFWKLWPMASIVDEVHKVIFVDGIYLAKNVVLLIASNKKYVLSGYLARAENSKSGGALISRIAPPEMVVTDGGTGFRKACSQYGGSTIIQRCLFHVFCQIRRYTTSRPKLPAGQELYAIACQLLHVRNENDAYNGINKYIQWESDWSKFLLEKTKFADGRSEYTHERLRSARNSLDHLIASKTLFSFTNVLLSEGEQLPSTNNAIEGGVNSQLRELLRNHRGLSIVKRVKACFGWCYMHSECPMSIKEILLQMPTDESIAHEYHRMLYHEQNYESIPQ